MKDGFIMLARRTFDHYLWDEVRVFSKFEAWLDLLQLAAFAPTKRIIQGKLIVLERGQLVASVRFLSARWGWKKDKVACFLGLIESDSMIRRETRHGQTVLTLCNFERYNRVLDTKPDSEPDKVQTETRQTPDKVEEREEREQGEGPPALCSLQQAQSYAAMCRLTPDEAAHWWHTRNAAGWTCGTQGGGAPRRITSWQSDMARSTAWIKESIAKSKHTTKPARAC